MVHSYKSHVQYNEGIKMRKILILMMPLLLLTACKEEVSITQTPTKAVKTITVSEDSKSNSRQISGVVKTYGESILSFRVGGRVASVNANIGDKVTKGQILAKLEQKEFSLAVQSAKAELASAKANLLQQSDNLKRQQNLKKKDFVAQSAVDQAQASFSAAKSSVDVANAKLKNSQNNLSDTTLKAPFDGSIASRSIEPFVEVVAGREIFNLQNEDGFKVEVLMPETLIGDINQGDSVSVAFPTLTDTTIKGNISEIGAKAETGNAFPISIDLAEKAEGVRSGMTAQVSFNFGVDNEVSVYLIPVSALDVRVPKQANATVKGQASIFTFNQEKGIAEKRKVKIRDIRVNEFEVVEGLSDGDMVIVAGVPFLSDGQKIKKWEPTYNAPATINLDR